MARRRVARKPAAKNPSNPAPSAQHGGSSSGGLPWPVIAILCLLVVIVIQGSIYWFDLFNGSEKAVASSDEKSASAADEKDNKEDSDASTEEEEEEGDTEESTDKKPKDDEVKSTGTFDKPFEEQGKKPEPEEAEKKEPETKPAVTEEKPQDPTKANPTAKPPETPAKDPPKAGPKPTAEPTPKPPAQPTDPFADLPDGLDLPEAGAAAGEPVVLAKLHPEEGKPVNLSLEGGETILGEKGEIALVRVPGQFSWNVKLKSTKDGDSEVGVFAVQDNQIMFAWKSSGNQPMANQLRNCRLRVATGTKFKRVALRTPQVIEPLVVKVDKGGSQQTLSVPGVPEGASDLQLEIVNLAATFPKHAFVPEPPIATEGKEVLIKIDGEKVRKVLILQVKFTKRNGEVNVTAKPVIEVPGRGNKKKLVPLNIKQAEGELNRLNALKTQGTQAFEQFKKSKPNADQLKKAEFTFNQQLAQLDLKISRLQALGEVYGKIHEKANLEFRVFVDVGGNQVELLRTSGAVKGAAKTEPEKPATPLKK